MPLTDPTVRNAKPQDKLVRLFDGGELYLEVTSNGGKCWRLKYRYYGKEKRISLGVYPKASLADARAERDSAKQLEAREPLHRRGAWTMAFAFWCINPSKDLIWETLRPRYWWHLVTPFRKLMNPRLLPAQLVLKEV